MRILRIVGIVGATAILLSAATAFADEQTTGAVREVKGSENRVMTASTTRGEIKEDVRERMKSASTTVRIQAVREEAEARMTTVREKAEKRMEDIQDKVKKDMAQKIAKQFKDLNLKWTDHFANLLERYDAIVQKMTDRSATAAAGGKDVAAANVAIQAAKTAIATARTAVTAQAAKTYTLDTSAIVTTSTSTTTPKHQEELMRGLRTAFQTLHTTLFKDLFALRDGAMTDARKAVQNALQSLSQVPRVDEDNATSTERSTEKSNEKSNQ